MLVTLFLPAIPKLPQVRGNRGVQPRALRLLLSQRSTESRHLLVKWLAIVRRSLRSDVPPRRQHMPMRANLLARGRLAESSRIFVLPRALVPSLGVIRPGDPREICFTKLPMRAIDQLSKLARIDEKGLTPPIPKAAVFLVAGQEPETNRDLR